MTSVSIDRITAEAREVRFWRTVLTVVAAVLYGLGWAAYKTCALAWFAVAWCAAAIRLGWTEAKAGGARGSA